ncbi:hypothetical protein GUJ93_ZPchr0011g27259 [Zizania palustris]|uniref:DUF629 domain-containing protein n=1 Tax=Zizania palustris TaxID=103762 RepID=A0A8J5WLF0_ZIZPA|nr:hypothetical protein GUJ93_ZPchr0011g27259 [Zizania palustris]
MGKSKHKEAGEAVARLVRDVDEASTLRKEAEAALRKEAEAALRLDRGGHHDEAIARAEELVAKNPESALVANLAALLHHNAVDRSVKNTSDKGSASKHLASARNYYIQANRLAPNCVEIATNLAMLRFVCIKDYEADLNILRASRIRSPIDPAENNVAYDLDGNGRTSKERVENAKKVTWKRYHQIMSYVSRKVIPPYVRDVLDIAERDGAAKGLKAAKTLADRYDYHSVRAGLTHVYINLEFVRGLAPNIDKRPFLRRVIDDVNIYSSQFDTSLLVALFRAKLFFVQHMYDLVDFECDRSISIKEPTDPGDEDVPPGSVAGEKPQDRETCVREEFVRLRRKLVSMSKDYWCSLTTEKQDSFAFVKLNSMLRYYLDDFEETHYAAKIISDALSYVKKNRSWRFWICPYCVGKKIPDTGSLLQHMRNKHPEGNVWPKLLSLLGPKLCDRAFKCDYFMDDVALCQDAEEQYSLHLKKMDHVFAYLLIMASKGYETQTFSDMREAKCTQGIEILEKIKFNEASCPEIRELWHDFLEISIVDYRYILSPHAISFFWDRLLKCMRKDKHDANEMIDAAEIDAVFPNVEDLSDMEAIFPNVNDAPDNNAADIDVTCPNVGSPSDSNAANVDSVCSNIGDAPDSNASNVDSVCSNIGDTPDSNVADADATCTNLSTPPDNNVANVDAICPSICDTLDSNAADIGATCPNVGSPLEKNASNVDAICSNIGDAPDSNVADADATCTNLSTPPDNNVANVDAICPSICDALDSNAADIGATCPNVGSPLEKNASNVDAICSNIGDAPDSNAADVDATCPNVGHALDSNVANVDAVCGNIGDAPNSNAADIDVTCPNIGDVPDNNAADVDATCLNVGNALDSIAANVDAICHNIGDAPGSNAVDIDATCLNVGTPPDSSNAANIDTMCSDIGDAPDNNATNVEAIHSNIDDAHESNVADIDAICPNIGESPDSNASNIDALCLTTANATDNNPADAPDRNSDIERESYPSYANRDKKDEVNQKQENIMPSCSDDILKTDGEDEESEEHAEDENSSTTSLWNLVHFRNKFLRILSHFDTRHQDPCIAEKLYKIFSAWEKNEHSEMALLLTDVKTTLCEIVNDSNIFQKLQVGRNFASEIMAIILEELHKYEISVFFGSEIVVIGSPCRYRIYHAVDLFGIKLKQLMSCKCGEWFGEEYMLFFHKLDASSPHTTKIYSFEELPMLIDSQYNCESRCNKCCGSVRQIDCFLSEGPHFFTIVLKDWLGGDEKQAILSEALFGIASPLDITFLYKGVTRPHKGGHSATNYRLTSVICYIEHRYVCFARDQDKWLKYDTMTVKAVDSWGEILQLYREINIQPEVLIYEVIK